MDPKLSKLDPKLKEAYDRVMNGPAAVPAPQGSTPPPLPPINAAPPHMPNVPPPPPMQPPVQNPNPVPPPPPEPNMPPVQSFSAQSQMPPPIPDPSPAISSTMAFNANNSDLNKGTTAVKKTSGKMKIVLLVLGVLIFLVIYTFVWVYLFHLKLPFIG